MLKSNQFFKASQVNKYERVLASEKEEVINIAKLIDKKASESISRLIDKLTIEKGYSTSEAIELIREILLEGYNEMPSL